MDRVYLHTVWLMISCVLWYFVPVGVLYLNLLSMGFVVLTMTLLQLEFACVAPRLLMVEDGELNSRVARARLDQNDR